MSDFGCIKIKSNNFYKISSVWDKYLCCYRFGNFISLKVIIYTGKYTYTKNDNTDMLKTVNVVCELCKTFEGRIVLFLLITFKPMLL